MATAAQLIAKRLAEAGCRRVFGVPGGEVLTLMEALRAEGIEFVLTKHENNAGFMAEGAWSATGAPPVLLTTIGPGLANAVNVVGNARLDRVPLIVISGAVDMHERQTYTHQVVDHGAILRPLVKASFEVVPGAADVIADKAVSIAMDAPPGPVHIDLPVGVAALDEPATAPIRRPTPIPSRPAGGEEMVSARHLLSGAERPLIIAGVETLESKDAPDMLTALALDFSIPVITTYKAKGVFPEEDFLSLGAAGLSPIADRLLMPLIAQSDLLLLVGYDPVEMRHAWTAPWDASEKPVIEFSATPNTHYVHMANVSFIGDIGSSLKTLSLQLTPNPDSWPDGEPARVRQELAEAYRADEDWGPAAVADEVRKALPDDAIACVDSGAHRILLSHVWPCAKPRTLLQSTGFATMGCALPLAIGAKMAAPERAVVAITGDAGLEMVLGELATLRDLALPVVIVIYDDASLALIEKKQREAQLPNLGVDYAATDWVALARAMGGRGVSVSDRKALGAAVKKGLAAETFTIVAAQIDRKAYDGRL
ncbi:MAG: thiamine pyrophosphate-binding protein [Rhodospirillales bacterium]|nr:MAG: thiamine pyrophosphate-binding protein [Rhodospirillales bacterium]